MIKTFLFSFKKSRLLAKIAAESRPKRMEVNGASLAKNLFVRHQYIEQLFALLATDKHTVDLLKLHNSSFDDLRKIISKLEYRAWLAHIR